MTDNVTHTHRERVSVSGEARSAAPRSRRVLRTGSPLGSLSFCSLTTRCVPSTPVHAGEFELLLGCLRSHFGTYKGPPAPPLAPGGVGALGSTPTPPPPPPAPPGLPASGSARHALGLAYGGVPGLARGRRAGRRVELRRRGTVQWRFGRHWPFDGRGHGLLGRGHAFGARHVDDGSGVFFQLPEMTLSFSYDGIFQLVNN